MKFFAFLLLITVYSSCSENYTQDIEREINAEEMRKGNQVQSYTVISQKDSAGWYVVQYECIVDNAQKSNGHIVFAKTGDGILVR